MNVWVGYGLVELFLLVVKVWALLTCLRYPEWAWNETGHSRVLWILVLVIGLFLPCIGFLLALWFLFSTSTDVRRVAQLGSRPGFPGTT